MAYTVMAYVVMVYVVMASYPALQSWPSTELAAASVFVSFRHMSLHRCQDTLRRTCLFTKWQAITIEAITI